MTPVIDLARARRRRHQRPAEDPCAEEAAATSDVELQELYRPLAPGAADTMRPTLRAWLECWADRRGIERPCLQRFVAAHRMGLGITIDSARHDVTTAMLLAPELLIALLALDRDPDALRADWPEDRRELDALADVFGRPFAV